MMRLLSIILFLVAIPLTANTKDQAEYEKVCGYFEALEKLPDQKSMTPTTRNTFISDKIQTEFKGLSNAKASWTAVASAVPEQRYELFKLGAESVLLSSWDCASMKRMAPVTGDY